VTDSIAIPNHIPEVVAFEKHPNHGARLQGQSGARPPPTRGEPRGDPGRLPGAAGRSP
jgi:hypothetical protein